MRGSGGMRGLIDRGLAKASGRTRYAACPSASLCGTGGDSILDTALRNVTHSDSAAIPREILAEAVRLATESEECLAKALRHVETNVCAGPSEWRRINGALLLLEQLLRPRESDETDVLVHRVWFESKIQERLKELKDFQHSEDRRVTMLVSRLAANVEKAFEKQMQLYEDDHESSTRLESLSEGPQAGRSVSNEPPSISPTNTSTSPMTPPIGLASPHPVPATSVVAVTAAAETASLREHHDVITWPQSVSLLGRCSFSRLCCCSCAFRPPRPTQASTEEKMGLAVIAS